MWGTLFKALQNSTPGEGETDVVDSEGVDDPSLDTDMPEGEEAEWAAGGFPLALPGPLRDTKVVCKIYPSPQDYVPLIYLPPHDYIMPTYPSPVTQFVRASLPEPQPEISGRPPPSPPLRHRLSWHRKQQQQSLCGTQLCFPPRRLFPSYLKQRRQSLCSRQLCSSRWRILSPRQKWQKRWLHCCQQHSPRLLLPPPCQKQQRGWLHCKQVVQLEPLSPQPPRSHQGSAQASALPPPSATSGTVGTMPSVSAVSVPLPTAPAMAIPPASAPHAGPPSSTSSRLFHVLLPRDAESDTDESRQLVPQQGSALSVDTWHRHAARMPQSYLWTLPPCQVTMRPEHRGGFWELVKLQALEMGNWDLLEKTRILGGSIIQTVDAGWGDTE